MARTSTLVLTRSPARTSRMVLATILAHTNVLVPTRVVVRIIALVLIHLLPFCAARDDGKLGVHLPSSMDESVLAGETSATDMA